MNQSEALKQIRLYFESESCQQDNMAIDSKFSANEILEISSANYKEIESKFYPWRTKIEGVKECSEVEKILEDRIEEIRESYDQTDQGGKKILEEEWIALVVSKDRNLHQRIDKENNRIKNEHFQQLYFTLKVLGTFSFSDPKEAVLKRNMAKMFHQVGKYCTRNNIDLEKYVKETVKNISMPPPVPPPPPPPPPVVSFCPPTFLHQTPKSSKTPKTHRVPIILNENRTPLQLLNQDLLRSIKHCRTAELKSTPFKRSPGGTPLKRQRRLSENDTSDVITIALRRKFKNVSVYSPNENKSPNKMKSPSLEFP